MKTSLFAERLCKGRGFSPELQYSDLSPPVFCMADIGTDLEF